MWVCRSERSEGCEVSEVSVWSEGSEGSERCEESMVSEGFALSMVSVAGHDTFFFSGCLIAKLGPPPALLRPSGHVAEGPSQQD